MHRFKMMLLALPLLHLSQTSSAEDNRQMVDMPPMMQQHMLANMRDHLATIDQVLRSLGEGEFDEASSLAEHRLGLSAMDDHGAAHMGKVMPDEMQAIGLRMHRAASRLSLVAQEGDTEQAYQVLTEVTSACVACHAAFRIR